MELCEETDHDKSQLPIFYDILQAAEAAEDSADRFAIQRFLISPQMRISTCPLSVTGPSKWWLAFGEYNCEPLATAKSLTDEPKSSGITFDFRECQSV